MASEATKMAVRGNMHNDARVIEFAEFKSEVNVKRIKAPEVHVVKDEDSFRFPMLEYDLNQPGVSNHRM